MRYGKREGKTREGLGVDGMRERKGGKFSTATKTMNQLENFTNFIHDGNALVMENSWKASKG